MKINHLGIIPDGNRRWAKANNVDLYKTYNIFANRIVEIFEVFQTSCSVSAVGLLSLAATVVAADSFDRISDHSSFVNTYFSIFLILIIRFTYALFGTYLARKWVV